MVPVELALNKKATRKRVPKTILKLPDLEQSNIGCAQQPHLPQFSALLRSCDSRVH
jgi:hypothetical protein